MSQPAATITAPNLLEVTGDSGKRYEEILTPEALAFLAELHQKFNDKRLALLETRLARQQKFDSGILPTFLPETEEIRNGDWTVAPIPEDILDRRVEITGPVDRKMVINALNSGANVFMADFEDSNSPTWNNCIEGQINLKDAVRKSISFTHPNTGKTYKLNHNVAVLFVRPRGWHLNEKHVKAGEQVLSASLFDFGLYIYHNAKTLIENGSGPYFYLPKLESHEEAKLWNEVFVFAQDYLNIPQGTIKATVLIETITAAFELDEILYELREHSAGLNCGRWDYIFSFIKKFKNNPDFVLPDRSKVNMTVPFMKSYTLAVIKACHKRNVHAMGGMAAQIPIKNDPERNEEALQKVINDKTSEVRNGHDGTWVAHPALVTPVKKIFDEHMPTKNQICIKRHDIRISEEQLLEVPGGSITEEGVRTNINVGILYVESWLQGTGAAALYHLMEDAATAEISRTQLWQWIHHEITLSDGRMMTEELYDQMRNEEIEKIKSLIGEDRFTNGRFDEAIALFDDLVKSDTFTEFLTQPAYKLID
ncbi:MAG: malate synthase A [Fulvivirga sp.]